MRCPECNDKMEKTTTNITLKISDVDTPKKLKKVADKMKKKYKKIIIDDDCKVEQ